jgi:hypothetical protein
MLYARSSVSVLSGAAPAFHVYHAIRLVFRTEDTARLAGSIVRWLLCTRSFVSVLSSATAAFHVYHAASLVFRAKDTM